MVTSKFIYESDFSKVSADLKNLVRQATETNTAFAQLNKTAAAVKMEAARTFAAQAGFAGFRTQVVDLTGATEGFGEALMRNKLTMKQYFSEAAKAYKKDSQAYKLAVREVARANSTVAAIGDVNGRRKGLLITPETIDTKNIKTRMDIANKQYEIFNDLVQKGTTSLVNWGKNTQWAGRQLTVGLTVPMGIFSTKAITAFKDVEKEITRFRKVYGSDLTNSVEGATDAMLEQVQAMGTEFAKNFGIASKETIALAADLAAAGFEGQKLANAVNQTTRLMVLGEVDRQEAMKATLSLQSAFKQSTEELAQSVDFLNAVENQTSASLQDLTEAIPKTGPVIRALGGDVKDLAVLMTALREGGIASGEGANAIKSGMASLISPTKQATEVARQFGIDLQGVVQRNKGELMPMLLDFQEQLRGLDDFGKAKVIEQIFGKYQFARMSALFDNLNQRGSQTIKMIELMDMSADELAKKSYSELQAQQNSAATRFNAVQQQLTNELVKIGAELAETLLPSLQTGLDILTKIVNGFNNLPEPVKNFAKIIGGAVAVAGPLLMLAGMMGNLVGNTVKFGMSIVNMFKRVTGNPVKQLEILSDQELAAKIAADQLTGAYVKQKTSVDALNKSLQMYVANLNKAASVAPPGSYSPIRPRRFQTGGIVFASNGMTEGRINGYGGGDKVPALLEPGEFIINKQSSQKYAPLLRDINQGKDIPGFNGGTNNGVGNVYPDLPNVSGAEGWSRPAVTPISNKIDFNTNSGALNMTGTFSGLPEGFSAKKTKQFEIQVRAMTESLLADLNVASGAFSGTAKEFLTDIGMKFSQSLFREKGMAGFDIPAIPADITREKNPGLHKLFKSLQTFAEIENALVPKEKSRSALSKWSASHALGARTFYGAENSAVFGKAFIGTTLMEPATFNELIANLAKSGGKGKTPNPSEQMKYLKGLYGPDLERLGYPSTQIDEIISTLSGTGAPVTKEGLATIDRFFEDILSDPELKAKAITNSAGKVSNTRLDQIKSIREGYTQKLLNMSAQEFADFRVDQFVMSTFNTVKQSDWQKTFGGFSRIEDQYEFLSKKFSGIKDIITNPNLSILEREGLIENYLARTSETITGVPVVSEETARMITSDDRAIAPEFDKDGKPMGGKKLSQFETDMKKVVAGEKAMPVIETMTYDEKQHGSMQFLDENERPFKPKPKQRYVSYYISTPRGPVKITKPVIGYNAGGIVRQIMSKSELQGSRQGLEMIQRGSSIDKLLGNKYLDPNIIAGLRKRVTTSPHEKMLFRGGTLGIEDFAKINVGDIIPIPGSKSYSTDPLLAERFANMNMPGGDYRILEKIFQDVGPMGNPVLNSKRASSFEDEAALMREMRIDAIESYRKARDSKQNPAARDAAIREYDELNNILKKDKFAFEPETKQAKARMEEIAKSGIMLDPDKQMFEARKKLYELRQYRQRHMSNKPVIYKLRTPEGTIELPVSDLVGGARDLKGMGTLDEMETILTNAQIKVLSKSTDSMGRNIIEGEVLQAQKFAFGGQVMPTYKNLAKFRSKNEPGYKKINTMKSAQELSADLRLFMSGGGDDALLQKLSNSKISWLIEDMQDTRRQIARYERDSTKRGVRKLEAAQAREQFLYELMLKAQNPENLKAMFNRLEFDDLNMTTIARVPREFEKTPDRYMKKSDYLSSLATEGYMRRAFKDNLVPLPGRESDMLAELQESRIAENERRFRDMGPLKKLKAAFNPRENFVQYRNKGGVIFGRGVDSGGKINGYGGGDTVPAMLEPGEFIINKKSSAKHAPLLRAINKDSLPGFNNGGSTLQRFNQAMGGGSGMMMNAMFLPMSASMIGQMDGFMKQITIATVALQGLVVAAQMAAMAQSGFAKMNTAKQIASSAAANPLVGGSAKATAANMGGGRLTQMMAASKAGQLTGLSRLGGMAATALFNPITLGVVATGAVLALGFMAWRKHVQNLAKDARSMYTQGTEMAKVYNIEIRNTTKALEENRKYAMAFGTTSKKVALGQVDKDYASAVTKNFKDLIETLGNASNAQQKMNMLSAQYASLISQGFSSNQAQEITAEIARQAGATAEYSAVLPKLKENVIDAADALDVLGKSVSAQISVLGTGEERLSALTAAYAQLGAGSGQAPTEFVQSINSVLDVLQDVDPDDLEQWVKDTAANAGLDADQQEKIFNSIIPDGDWGSEKALELSQAISAAVQMGIDITDLGTPKLTLEDLQIDIAKQAVMQEMKLKLNATLEEVIDGLESNLDAVNDYYDKAVLGIQREIEAIQKGAEEKQEILEKEAEMLDKRKDAIADATDFYISQLQKEYEAEQFYQKQRDTALGGLQSLSQGDVFGFLQAQQEAASNAAQFGREQAIAQIEETSDAAQGAIDEQLVKNRDAQSRIRDDAENAIEGKQKEMENLEAARSKLVKEIKDEIEEARAIIDSPNMAGLNLTKFEKKLNTYTNKLPEDLKLPFTEVGKGLKSEFQGAADASVAEVSRITGISAKLLADQVEDAMGTVVMGAGGQILYRYQNADFEIDIKKKNKKDENNASDAGDDVLQGAGTRKNPYLITSNKLPDIKKFSSGEFIQLANGKVYQVAGDSLNLRRTYKEVSGFNRGGKVTPMKYSAGVIGVPGFGNYDKVPALLTPGETVVDRSTTRRNKYALAAMAAGVSFDMPNANSYGKLGDRDIEINKVNMGGVNVNINAAGMSPEQLERSVIKALDRAVTSIETSRGGIK